ncbi:MAG: hypothetical protein ABI723_07160 [Bacteroidia bacterium]
MKTIIFQTKEEQKTNLIMELLKQLKIKTHVIDQELAEELHITKLINQGMKEEGEVSLATVRKKLRK